MVGGPGGQQPREGEIPQRHRSLEADPCPIHLSGESQMVLEGKLSGDQGLKGLVKLCPESWFTTVTSCG